MSKSAERMFFFVFAPIGFIWMGLQVLSHPEQCANAQTSGCEVGGLLTPVILALLIISIGFVFRRRRIKKEKTTHQT